MAMKMQKNKISVGMSLFLGAVVCIAFHANALAQDAKPSTPEMQVQYDHGILSVTTNGASFRKVLEEIAKVANIKITGAPDDEKIYGPYGPGKVSTVISALLDDPKINFIFVEHQGVPNELIISKRTAGPTPPSAPAVVPALNAATTDAEHTHIDIPLPAALTPGAPVAYAIHSAEPKKDAPTADTKIVPAGAPGSPGIATAEEVFERLSHRPSY